jgi:hypothetical protein
MGPGELHVLEELVTGVIISTTIILIAFSPIAKAIGKWIMHGRLPAPGTSQVVDDERVDQLSGEVAALRRELDATHERLDFTERMLAQSRERGALPAPRNG